MITMTARCRKAATLSALFGLSISVLFSNSELRSQEPLPAQADGHNQDQQVDVLTKGPLHEAFAAVHQADPTPSPVISKQPPAAIEEVPPEFKPDGENVQWLPGYWAWFEEEDDFIWVSGLWRDIPPNRRWVPGYWEQLGGGSRWVSGFWAEENVAELDYLPEPPPNLDRGPSVDAPADNYFYVPGNWIYQESNYVWRAGYWMPRIDNRIWVPACYVWTPCGFVYRSGYWDYCVDHRGVLFAPVCYRSPIYLRTNYYYTPTCTINTNFSFMVHLFFRPNHCHYYFGDWYHPGYGHWDYCSWIDTLRHHRRYDPLCAYYSHRHTRYKGVRAWDWCRTRHRFYVDHHEYRPKRTFHEQETFVSKHATNLKNESHRKEIVDSALGTQLADAVKRKAGSQAKLTSVSAAELTRYSESVKTLSEFTDVRRNFEKARTNAAKKKAIARAQGLEHRATRLSLKVPQTKPPQVDPSVLPQAGQKGNNASPKIANRKNTTSQNLDPRKQRALELSNPNLTVKPNANQRKPSVTGKKPSTAEKQDAERWLKEMQSQLEASQKRQADEKIERETKLAEQRRAQMAAQKRAADLEAQKRQQAEADAKRLRDQQQARQRQQEIQDRLLARQRQLEKTQSDTRRKQQEQQQAEQAQKEKRRLEVVREQQEKAKQRSLAAERERQRQATQMRDLQSQQRLAEQQKVQQERARQLAEAQKAAQHRAQMQNEAQKRADQQRKATQSRLDQQRASREAAEKRAAQHLAAQQRAAQKQAEQRASQQRADQQRATQQKLADQRAAQKRIADQRAAQQKAAAQQAAQQKAAQQRMAEQRAAQQRAAQQRAAQQRAQEQAAKRAAQQAAQRAAQQKAAEQMKQRQRQQQQQQRQQQQKRQQQQRRNNGKGTKPG